MTKNNIENEVLSSLNYIQANYDSLKNCKGTEFVSKKEVIISLDELKCDGNPTLESNIFLLSYLDKKAFCPVPAAYKSIKQAYGRSVKIQETQQEVLAKLWHKLGELIGIYQIGKEAHIKHWVGELSLFTTPQKTNKIVIKEHFSFYFHDSWSFELDDYARPTYYDLVKKQYYSNVMEQGTAYAPELDL